jgi:hypothetical protein
MITEQRRDPRHQLSLKCWIVCEDGKRIECHAQNFSKEGAFLTVDSAEQIPSHFTLAMTVDGQVSRSCRVAWTNGDKIGVEFISSKSPNKPKQLYL